MNAPDPDQAPAHASGEDAACGLSYSYRPSLLGAPFEFRLGEEALEWRVGRGSGRIPYGLVSRVRLQYRPATMQGYRFLMEIWALNAPKLVVASTSLKGLIEQQRHDADYVAFVRELHRRIARSGAPTVFDSGSVALLYWPGLAVFTATGVALVALGVHALWNGAWVPAGIVGFFLVMFLWQAGNFFLRNRPQRYDPTAIPELVLPRS